MTSEAFDINKMTPEQQAKWSAMADATNTISKACDGMALDIALAGLLNNIGTMMQTLHKAGDEELLMRTANGLAAAAEMAADMVRALEATKKKP
jgi:hypothetical protein